MSNYGERIYVQFQKEKDAYRRWLLAALVLVVFYGLVFRPYLTLLTNLAELEFTQLETDKQIKLADKEIKTATYAIDRASSLMGDASEYQRLYADADGWIDSIDEIEQKYDRQSRLVARLHDSLPSADKEKWQIGKIPNPDVIESLRDLRPELMRNYRTKDGCFFRIEADWVACQVDRKRKPINDKLFRVLYDRSEAHAYTASLKEQIESNKKKYSDRLPGALSGATLKQWVKAYLDEEQAIIRKWYEYMARERQELVRKSNLYQEKKKKHALAEARLDQRKKDFNQTGEIDTPIGRIKLSFHDLLSLVPFLWLFILSGIVRSTSRQLLLRSTFQANGPKDETTPEALSLTMPIWLEPLNSRIINRILLAVPALLAIAAMIGLWQVLHNPGLEILEVKLNNVFVIFLTLLAGIIFAVLYRRLIAVLSLTKS